MPRQDQEVVIERRYAGTVQWQVRAPFGYSSHDVGGCATFAEAAAAARDVAVTLLDRGDCPFLTLPIVAHPAPSGPEGVRALAQANFEAHLAFRFPGQSIARRADGTYADVITGQHWEYWQSALAIGAVTGITRVPAPGTTTRRAG